MKIMNNSTENLVRENIKKLVPYSSARSEFKGTAGIFLDANENPYGTYNRYPDPFQLALKEKLAVTKGIRPEQLFLSNGSDGIVDMSYRIFCEPGKDKALTFAPTFGMYTVAAALNNVTLIKVPLDADFQIAVETFKPYLADPHLKLVFLCSPNNPTGNHMHREAIDFVLDNFNGIIILDEAYIDFSTRASYTAKLAQYPNLVILQTMSKAWGLAGGRVGMAIMNEHLVAYYNKIKTPYNVSSINQETALKVLNEKAEYDKNLAAILAEKNRVITALENNSLIQKIYPSDTNFLLVKVADANKLYTQLTQHQIIVRNQDRVIKKCLRITIGTPEENTKLIEALQAINT